MGHDNLPSNVREVLSAASAIGASAPGVVAVALVGSWARSGGRPDSDVDLVVLTTDPDALLAADATSWFSLFGVGARLVRAEDFGLLQERRLRRADGLEVEVGIGRPEWASVDAPDDGSAQVVRDGMRILFDPLGLLAAFATAVL